MSELWADTMDNRIRDFIDVATRGRPVAIIFSAPPHHRDHVMDMWMSATAGNSDDVMVIVDDGVPKLSCKCWKDIWNGFGYEACDAPTTSDIGLCDEHKQELTQLENENGS